MASLSSTASIVACPAAATCAPLFKQRPVRKVKSSGSLFFKNFEHDAGLAQRPISFLSLLLSRLSSRRAHALFFSVSLSRTQRCSPDRVSRGLSWPAAPRRDLLGPRQHGLDASPFSLLRRHRRQRRRRRNPRQSLRLLVAATLSGRPPLLRRQSATTKPRDSSSRQLSRRRSPRRRSPGSPRRPRHSPTTRLPPL